MNRVKYIFLVLTLNNQLYKNLSQKLPLNLLLMYSRKLRFHSINNSMYHIKRNINFVHYLSNYGIKKLQRQNKHMCGYCYYYSLLGLYIGTTLGLETTFHIGIEKNLDFSKSNVERFGHAWTVIENQYLDETDNNNWNEILNFNNERK